MSDLEDRLNSILSDPEQMARIQNLAQSLMGGGEGEAGAAPPSPMSDWARSWILAICSGSLRMLLSRSSSSLTALTSR